MHQENITRVVAGSRNPELAELIDIPVFQEMISDYYSVTGVAAGIMDVKGRVIVSTRPLEIGANLHQAAPTICKFCHENDNYFSNAAAIKTLESHRCINNMWDTLTPIMISGKHIGNIFFEQFFYNDEDLKIDLFRSQACCSKEDQDAHLLALLRLPRLSKKTIQSASRFYLKVAQMLSKTEALPSSEGQHAVSLDKSKASLWDWNAPIEIPKKMNLSEVEKDEGHFMFKEVNGEWLWVSICGKMVEVDGEGKTLQTPATLSNIFKRRR